MNLRQQLQEVGLYTYFEAIQPILADHPEWRVPRGPNSARVR